MDSVASCHAVPVTATDSIRTKQIVPRVDTEDARITWERGEVGAAGLDARNLSSAMGYSRGALSGTRF